MRPLEATYGDLAPPYRRSLSNPYEDDPKDASTRYLPLYKAVDGGDLEATKKFLDQHPDALCSSLSTDGDTALHIAVLAGHVDIVEELVGRLSALELAVKQKYGSTALNFAAIGGVTEIAELLVEKNRKLLEIPNDHEQIPLVVAALYGHRDLVQYLYLKTPIEELDPTSKNHGAILLTACIMDEFYDIALDLVQRYPLLAIAEDTDKDTALHILAQKPSAFPSGSQLTFWQRWTYKCIHLDPQKASLITSGDIEMPHEGPPHRRSFTKRVLHQISEAFWKGLKLCVPGFTSIYELKLTHLQARELLTCICREVPNLEDEIKREAVLRKALFEAVKQGVVEFVTEIMKHYPEVVWFYDDKDRNIFFVATAERQEKIFSLIYKMGAKKNSLATHWDKDFNNMLHQAAFLAPSSRLDRVSGAALQMQRELQWFKEVESVVQPKYKEMINSHFKTPRALFSDYHKKLVEQGEQWTKETAESCTVVTALIVTIMFSAVFTVPGGYDNNSGNPIYLNQNSFLVFIVSDALSLFSSTTSLLMFLGILTSRYREEDFLQTVPTKLMIGLSMMFFSLATMMITFGVALFIVLRDRIAWVSFPIILLASLPVTLFALLQFPLLVEIFISTYGPGIFDKPKKNLCPSGSTRSSTRCFR
ncbi:hypothetical protein J1N35_014647 [Gossypium stocksii]|uniref:PGG domain-containing protein n=1 Tax=Gossypium stocksii TaxID=47602 RepID=A0A9D3VWX5_9ROSI|nr:hypothetical protein J1N35_014647 [Gossypium stocksii]